MAIKNFESLDKYVSVIFFEKDSEETKKLIGGVLDPLLVHITSDQLKDLVLEKYKRKEFPFLKYKNTIVLPEDDIKASIIDIDKKTDLKLQNFIEKKTKKYKLTILTKCKNTVEDLLIKYNIKDFKVYKAKKIPFLKEFLNKTTENEKYPKIYLNGQYIGGRKEFKKLIKETEKLKELKNKL